MDRAGGCEGEGKGFEVHIFLHFDELCFLLFIRYGAGVATPDPGEAPPMAVFSCNRWLFVTLGYKIR